ncbi:MAG TPA: hypothetical protein VEC99_18345 [Clostridia bacterium]|nr:hypothetical protein [Clostridia bacterium]
MQVFKAVGFWDREIGYFDSLEKAKAAFVEDDQVAAPHNRVTNWNWHFFSSRNFYSLPNKTLGGPGDEVPTERRIYVIDVK